MRKKIGRPKTNRKPILVRFDTDIIKMVDAERKKTIGATRPDIVRLIVKYYFYKRFMGLDV